MIKTDDGSFTLKSDEYNECYHSKEGALKETLYKHIYPAFKSVKKDEVNILDICFGLGYNTFASILKNRYKKINIFSPELNIELINSLNNFNYPKEFDSIKFIINDIIKNKSYEDKNIKIELFIGDAREYIKNFPDNFFDIVYQDAFSPKVNKELWSIEYFKEIKRVLKKDGVITTYSVATPVRCALYKLGFNLYTHPFKNIRKGTIASLKNLNFKKIDFEEKLKRIECRYYED